MKILDHGHINLVSHMGNELSIVNAARVSYGGVSEEITEKDIKLLKYLWDNKHTSPFEHVTLTFDVKAPIFVFRQWHRHRTWSYNEISARYTELPEEFYVPEPSQITEQSKRNKQQRTENEIVYSWRAAEIMRRAAVRSFNDYRELLEIGVPRELARTVLPVSTYSQMFATVNLLNLLKFLGLRDHDHAQYEIRVYAQGIKELIRPLFPNVLEIFEKC